MAKEADNHLLEHLNSHPEAVMIISRSGGEYKCSWYSSQGLQEMVYVIAIANRAVNRALDEEEKKNIKP